MDGGHVALVVDDDPDTCHSVKDLLEMAVPVVVHMASSVAEAHQTLEQLRVDLVIVDYMIPGDDTVRFVQELQARWACQAFFYTAVPRLPPGLDVRVVRKSFGPEALISTVREHLARRK